MVLQVHRALDSRSEIANSANDAIRADGARDQQPAFSR